MKPFLCFFSSHPRLSFFVLGALCALPFLFSFLFLVPFAALIPAAALLFREARERKKRSLFSMGFCFFFGYHLPVYSFFLWMYPLESTGLGAGAALGIVCLAWLGLSALHGALFAAVFPLFSLISRRASSVLTPLVFSCLWVAVEFITEQGTLAFPWSRLASGLWAFTPFLQSASLLGSLFVSFLAVLIPSLLADALTHKRSAAAFGALGLFCLNLGYGVAVSFRPWEGESTLTVTAVQGNILSGEKWQEGQLGRILETYFALSEEGAGSDLILWPESAVPVDLSLAPAYEALYADLSRKLKAPILMGTFLSHESGRQQNAVVAVDENGVFASYAKRHLVPFGEYVPWRGLLTAVVPALGEINQLSSDLLAGTDSEVMDVEGVKIGALVCFDSAFPALSRDACLDGARLLVLATNDSWYKDSPATVQHLSQSVLRAVENRRSVAVAANSGISAFISPQGQVTSLLEPLVEGTLTDEVGIHSSLTLYTLWGDAPLLIACTALCFAAFLTRKKGIAHESQ